MKGTPQVSRVSENKRVGGIIHEYEHFTVLGEDCVQ